PPAGWPQNRSVFTPRTHTTSLFHSSCRPSFAENLIPEDGDNPCLLPASSVLALVRRARTFAKRAERSFGEGQVTAATVAQILLSIRPPGVVEPPSSS